MNFLKKLFGGGSNPAVDVIDQATSSATAAASQAEAAAAQAQAAATQAQTAASAAADQAQAAGSVDLNAGALSGLADSAKDLLGGGMPDIAGLQDAIGKLSQGELSAAATEAMDAIPAETRGELGGLLAQAPGVPSGAAGIASGEPAALGDALGGLLKGDGGLGALAGLFGGGGSGASGGGGGGMLGDVMGAAGGSGGGFDLGALMSNPMAKTVLAALLPAIMKAVKGKG